MKQFRGRGDIDGHLPRDLVFAHLAGVVDCRTAALNTGGWATARYRSYGPPLEFQAYLLCREEESADAIRGDPRRRAGGEVGGCGSPRAGVGRG